MKCQDCKFCDTTYATRGYGYCNIKLPSWVTISTNSTFGADKLVCVKDDGDSCDLGLGSPGEIYLPTDPGFL